MLKTCYSARYFHFLLTFFIHYFSSVSYAISSSEEGVGGGGGRGWRFGPLCCQPPSPLFPAQVPVLPDLGSLIFIRFYISFFFFKVRIFLLKSFRGMYTTLYQIMNCCCYYYYINRRPSFGPFSKYRL